VRIFSAIISIRQMKTVSSLGDGRENKTASALPKIIIRNTIFLAVIQALINSSMQMIPSLAGLIMLRFTGSITLVGLTLSIITVAGMVMSYPAGKLSDTFGRRPVLLLGLLQGGLGSVLLYFSVINDSFGLFIIALLINGLAQGSVNQIRVSAIDMYPASRKAEGVSYVMTGGALGSLLAPIIVMITTGYAERAHLDTLSIPWLAQPIILALASFLVFSVRPDPLIIASSIDKYYPTSDLKEANKPSVHQPSPMNIASLLRYFPVIAAIVSISLSGGIMLMMMSLVSVVLRQNNVDLTLISVSIAIHVLGMFGLSFIFGRLADKYGRRSMFIVGSTLLGLGALITPLTTSYLMITLGIFLVGLGWSAVVVAATALIGDVSPPTVLGRLMGLTQLIAGVLSLGLPIVGGLVSQTYGFTTLGVLGALSSLPIFLLALLLANY
jgi:MFS family permease